jgi:hypothetical protein
MMGRAWHSRSIVGCHFGGRCNQRRTLPTMAERIWRCWTRLPSARRDGVARRWAICGGCVCAAAAIPPPMEVQAVPRRIAPGKDDVQDGVEPGEGRRSTDQMVERVRRWLHLPPKEQGTTTLICHALPATAAWRLSLFVAGGATPCQTAVSLQPLEKEARSKNFAGWHRFCPLLVGRPDTNRSDSGVRRWGHGRTRRARRAPDSARTLCRPGTEPHGDRCGGCRHTRNRQWHTLTSAYAWGLHVDVRNERRCLASIAIGMRRKDEP